MTEQFTCARCGKTYPKAWSEEEAMAELAELFPGVAVEECAVVCDDCHRLMGLS